MSYFLGYAWIPLISGLVFLGGLIAMLAAWAAEGHPDYRPDEGSIVYISDVGAHLKPLFISITPPPVTSANGASDLCYYCTGVCAQSSHRSILAT
jgi:hypothetical protein